MNNIKESHDSSVEGIQLFIKRGNKTRAPMPPALRVNVTSKFQGVDSSRLHYQTHQIPLIRMDSSLIIEFTPGRANYYAIFLYFLPMADLELNSVFKSIRKYKRLVYYSRLFWTFFGNKNQVELAKP